MRCRVPGCDTKAFYGRVICHQHQHIVGWRLAARVQAAWSNRMKAPTELDAAMQAINTQLKEISDAHTDAESG